MNYQDEIDKFERKIKELERHIETSPFADVRLGCALAIGDIKLEIASLLIQRAKEKNGQTGKECVAVATTISTMGITNLASKNVGHSNPPRSSCVGG